MASEGPNYPAAMGTRVNGSISWLNANNVGADDSNSASCSTTLNGFASDDIKANAFGFSIPGGASIDGIEMRINRGASDQGASKYVTDLVVQLNAGTLSSNKADTVTKWPITLASVSYGGAADLWGMTPTPAQINSSSFTAWLGCNPFTDSTTVSAYVNYIRITITYTITAGGGSNAGAFLGMINPRKLISIPGLILPRPRPRYQFCQIGQARICRA